MKGWSRNAVTFGVASAVVTVLLNWIGNATATGDPCHRSSPLGLLAFLVFLGLMGAAGLMTTRAGETVGMATVAGLVGAVISAAGTAISLAIILASFNASQCVQNNTSGVSTGTLIATGGIVLGIVISLIGLGFGAAAGALGGLIGKRPAAATV
jgi:hypothetical protein